MNSLRRREVLAGYLFIAPLNIGLLVFYFWSFFQNIYYSMTNKKSLGAFTFIGLDNYAKLVRDPKFYSAIGNTMIYVIVCVPLVVMISILLAALLNQQIRMRGMFRTLIFLPAVTMPAAVALLWKWLFNYEFGLINGIIRSIGGQAIAWLSEPYLAIYSVCFVFIWSTASYQMIILLAGLQGISRSYSEAGEIDGANRIQIFTKIILPLLSPTIFFVTVTTTINVFQLFDFIYLMIPKNSSGLTSARSLVYMFYDASFVKFTKGYGAAVSMALFVLVFIATLIQFKFQDRFAHYE